MFRHIQSAVIAASKRAPWFRRGVRKGLQSTRGTTYRLRHRAPVREKTALFESFHGRSYSGSPRAIYEAALKDERFADWRFVWACSGPEAALDSFEALGDPRTRVVAYRGQEYHEASATAQWWVTNSIMPNYLVPRDGQQQIQTWHGTPFKQLGADIIDNTTTATNDKNDIIGRYRRAADQASYILSSSPFTSRTFTSAFVLSETQASRKLLPTGNPRNDVLINASEEDSAKARTALSIPADTKVVLYAPTWRDDQHSSTVGYTYQLAVDFRELQQRLGDDYIILFRAHYLVSSQVDLSDFEGFVIDVSLEDDINDIYLASDILVTDYSSSLFDFGLLDRPMIFHMYDLENYRDQVRGLYFDVRDLPGPVCRTDAILADLIMSTEERQVSESAARLRFRDTFATFDDGQATNRVLSLMLGSPAATFDE